MSDKRQQLIQDVLEAMGSVRGSFAHGHGPMFRKHGFGMPHFKLLMKMAASDEGVSVSELSQKLGITPGAVTQFIDKLVDKGMVERLEDPADRRVVRIKLTDKARTKFRKMREFHFERMKNMFKNLSDEELEKLAEIVKKIEVEPDDQNSNWRKWREDLKKDIK